MTGDAPRRSQLSEVLAAACPTIAADPAGVTHWCWVARALLRDGHAGLEPLVAAVAEVERCDQRDTLVRSIRDAHPARAAHSREHDRLVQDCLTEACAFAWATSRGMQVRFDKRTGLPDLRAEDGT